MRATSCRLSCVIENLSLKAMNIDRAIPTGEWFFSTVLFFNHDPKLFPSQITQPSLFQFFHCQTTSWEKHNQSVGRLPLQERTASVLTLSAQTTRVRLPEFLRIHCSHKFIFFAFENLLFFIRFDPNPTFFKMSLTNNAQGHGQNGANVSHDSAKEAPKFSHNLLFSQNDFSSLLKTFSSSFDLIQTPPSSRWAQTTMCFQTMQILAFLKTLVRILLTQTQLVLPSGNSRPKFGTSRWRMPIS